MSAGTTLPSAQENRATASVAPALAIYGTAKHVHRISHQNSNTARRTIYRVKRLRKLKEILSFSFLLLL